MGPQGVSLWEGPWPMLIQPTICGSKYSRQPKPYYTLKGTRVPYALWDLSKYLLILITIISKRFVFHFVSIPLITACMLIFVS